MGFQLSRANCWLFLFAAALLFVGIRIYLIDLYGVMTPYWDDWGMGGFLSKSVTTGLSFADFYEDANEHRLVFNRILSLLLFKANQEQWDPMISMLANAVIWALSGVFLLRLAIKNATQINAPLFIALIFFLWAFPLAFVNAIWGIQTHNYTMILFALLGCWYSGYRPLSLAWWIGIFSLGAACLTLAGGSFAAFSVVTVQLLILLSGAGNRRDCLLTIGASLAMGVFGIALILVQGSSGVRGDELHLANRAASFFMTLSWPIPRMVWPAVIGLAPVVALTFQAIRNQTLARPMIRFAICVYGFVVIVALGVAYARGYAGAGPARRYFEFLALLSVASFLALQLLQCHKTKIARSLFSLMVVAWIALFAISIPWQNQVLAFTIAEHQELRPIQTTLVKRYLNTGETRWFEKRPDQHVPYPFAEKMDDILDTLNASDVLPYRLQTPAVIKRKLESSPAEISASPFIKNGTIRVNLAQHGLKHYEEDVYGSYKPGAGGMRATGRFVSEVIELSRPFASVLVTGYFGYPGMSMHLENEISGDKIELEVPDIDSKHAQSWREILVEVPRGYYRLVANDNNTDLWFGFSTPRTVGRLSYWTQQILSYSYWIWRIALILLFLAIAKPLAGFVSLRAPNG